MPSASRGRVMDLTLMANQQSQDVTSVHRVPKLGWRVAEIAAAFSLGKSTVHRDIANGLLKSRKLGNTRIVLTHDLLEYVGADPAALVMTEVPSSHE